MGTEHSEGARPSAHAAGDAPAATADAVSARPRLHPLARVALLFMAVTLSRWSLHQVADALFGAGYTRGGHVARAVAALVVDTALVLAALRWLDRRPLADLGVPPWREARRWVLVGAAAWALPAAVGAAVCLGMGWASIARTEPLTAAATLVVLRLALVVAYEAVPEELVFRGYLYRNLERATSAGVAVVGQAVLFTLWGVLAGSAASVERVVLFLSFALLLGGLRRRTGTVWTTIGFHTVFQTVAQVLGPPETAFAVEGLRSLQVVAFVVLPFVLGVPVAGWIARALPARRGSGIPS